MSGRARQLIEIAKKEQARMAWQQSRGVCSVQDPSSLQYITQCSSYGHSECPQDCALYKENQRKR